jgi:protein tyrosine phosphatase (PTP) superfamily phosphohydrolase (DUF442 family)
MKKYLFIIIIIIVAFAAGFFFFSKNKKTSKNENSANAPSTPVQEDIPTSPAPTTQSLSLKNSTVTFVGPRQGVDKSVPSDGGFWDFAVAVPNVLSRSGQPTLKDFQWLKDNGWKSIVDLRIDGDHNEVSDDANIPGFNALGFNYLKIQMVDGAAPTDNQAKQFLDFATKPENQPLHVHCRGGYGRAGVMAALFRYSVQGWPVDKAIDESKLFHGGIDDGQQKWLHAWAEKNPPGNYAK